MALFSCSITQIPRRESEKGPFGDPNERKDRLETLMLLRRSVSDASIMKPANIMTEEYSSYHAPLNDGGPQANLVRLKLRLPKVEVEKLMMQSKDESEVAEKIMRLCVNNNDGVGANLFQNKSGLLMGEENKWKNNNNGRVIKKGIRSREKRVGFLPITEGEIQLAVPAS